MRDRVRTPSDALVDALEQEQATSTKVYFVISGSLPGFDGHLRVIPTVFR